MAISSAVADSSSSPPSFRTLIKAMGGYSIAMLLQRLISFILLPLYTHFLRPADYAVLELMDMVGNVTSLLLGVRLGQAVFYYYFHAESEKARGGYVSTAFTGAVLLGILPFLCFSPFARPLSSLIFGDPRYGHLLRVFLIGLAGSFPVEIGFCYLRVLDRARAFTIISTARIAAALVLNIIFLAVFHLGVAAILWSTVAVNAGMSVCMAVMIFSQVRLSFTRKQMIEMFRYSLPLGLSGLGEFVLHFGDRIFLRPNVSLSILGLYSVAYKTGMIVAYASGPFYTYWNAQMVGIVRSPAGERLYTRTATYVFLGLSCVGLLLTVFTRPMLAVIAAPDYAPAAQFIPWIALAYVIRGIGSYFLNTFLLEKRPREVAKITWMAAGVCLGGYALLVPRYKVWGAVIATLLGFSVALVVALWKSQQARPFPYEYGRWIKIIFAGVAAVILNALLHPPTFWTQVAVASGATALFLLVLIASGFLDAGERQSLAQILRFLRLRPR
jgi:O-antigen/teichoic acid export membrane protein